MNQINWWNKQQKEITDLRKKEESFLFYFSLSWLFSFSLLGRKESLVKRCLLCFSPVRNLEYRDDPKCIYTASQKNEFIIFKKFNKSLKEYNCTPNIHFFLETKLKMKNESKKGTSRHGERESSRTICLVGADIWVKLFSLLFIFLVPFIFLYLELY